MGQQTDRNGVDIYPAVAQTKPLTTDTNGHTSAERQTDSSLVVDLRSRQPIVVPNEGIAWQLRFKRVVDVVGALLALVVLSPVIFVTALLIALTSRGPVFFRQERVGRFGEEFRFLKFRSMYLDAEARKVELTALNQHVSGPIFKIKGDPRITPVGKVIRKLSIDELPQLLHVLSGKMSLVGPRPPLPSEVESYGSHEWKRLMVKPGITCIWQVNGRSDLDFATWVDMDIEYIENWNLWLDLTLLLKTIPAVLTGRGAY